MVNANLWFSLSLSLSLSLSVARGFRLTCSEGVNRLMANPITNFSLSGQRAPSASIQRDGIMAVYWLDCHRM